MTGYFENKSANDFEADLHLQFSYLLVQIDD